MAKSLSLITPRVFHEKQLLKQCKTEVKVTQVSVHDMVKSDPGSPKRQNNSYEIQQKVHFLEIKMSKGNICQN